MTSITPKFSFDEQQLAELCRKWKVKRLSLFGSALREDFGPDSDVDLVVDFDPESHWSLFDVVTMQEDLKSFFKRDVDIVEMEAVTNPISRRIITRSMKLVYEG